MAGRACQLASPGFSAIRETLTEYDPVARRLAYDVAEGLPAFVTRATNTRWLTAEAPARTILSMRVEATTRGAMGTLASPMMRIMMRRTLVRTAEDLRHYLVTGSASPRKQAQLAQQSATAASRG